MTEVERLPRSGDKAVVLIVEDEWLVATDLVEEVTQAGYEIAGPAYSVASALEFIAHHVLSAAVLDVHLRRETSYPVAEELSARGVPFTFLTGYSRHQIRSDFRDVSVLSKPVAPNALRRCLSELIGPG